MVTKDFSDISKRHSHLKHTAHTGIFEDDNIMVVLAVPNSNSTVTLNAATVTIKTFNELKFKTQAELDVSLKAIEVKVDKIKDLQTGKDRFIGVRRVDKPGVYRSNRKEIFGTVISRTKPAERKNEFSRVSSSKAHKTLCSSQSIMIFYMVSERSLKHTYHQNHFLRRVIMTKR